MRDSVAVLGERRDHSRGSHVSLHCRHLGISSGSSAGWEEFVLQPSTVCSFPEPLSTCTTSCFPRRSLLMACLSLHSVPGTGVSSSAQSFIYLFYLSLLFISHKGKQEMMPNYKGFFSLGVFFFFL